MEKNITKISFTVLTSVYFNDDPAKLSLSLRSILGNTVLPNNIIVIVDGLLPKKLNNVLDEFKSNNLFEFILSDKNRGLANALNLALNKISTEWIFRSDADDINLLNRFEKFIEFIKSNPDVDVFGCQIMEFDDKGKPSKKRIVPTKHSDILNGLKYQNPFNHMTVAYRSKLFNKVEGYPNLYLREDYGLWIKFAVEGVNFANSNDVLVHVSAGNNMIRRRGGLKYALAEIELQQMIVKSNINNKICSLFVGVLRFLIFLMPFYIRRNFYQKILRK